MDLVVVPKPKRAQYLYVFTPSLSGLLLYVFLAGATIILNQFDMIRAYLQLPSDLHLTRQIAEWADHLLTSTIGTTRTQTLVVGLFWAVVGLGVYAFLQGVARILRELDDNLAARHYIWPRGADRARPLRALIAQVLFRATAFIGLLLVIVLGVAAILRGPVFVGFLGSNRIVQYVVWFVVSVLTWHAAVVLLRLVALRARLFG